jgi:hypothetical protein
VFYFVGFGQQQQQQQQIWRQQQLQQLELQRVLEAKREQLRQLDESTRRMHEQLAARQGESERRHPQGGATQLGDAGRGAGESKLDAILAQTLQMQTMFMAQMAGQGAGFGGAMHAPHARVGNNSAMAHHYPVGGVVPPAGAWAGAHAQPSDASLGAQQQQLPLGHSPAGNIQANAMLPQAAAPSEAGGYAAPEHDVHLLNQLQGMAEKLNRADIEAKEAAESALEKARAQVGAESSNLGQHRIFQTLVMRQATSAYGTSPKVREFGTVCALGVCGRCFVFQSSQGLDTGEGRRRRNRASEGVQCGQGVPAGTSAGAKPGSAGEILHRNSTHRKPLGFC